MRTNLFKSLMAAVALTAIMPLSSIAQDKEFYLRPSYWRPWDQRGINVFETSKVPDSIPYEGPRIRFGAGFTQQFQKLTHENSFTTSSDATNLYKMTSGFNTAQANLNIDIQLADGIRLSLENYLSARHHNETWVKGGYIQFDKLPFEGKFWDNLMELATIKIGHMQINYGDAQFRRSDGGNTIYNPFMENYIVDAFTTEIGGEIYLQKNGLIGMIGVTNGMIKGNVDLQTKTAADDNIKKSPAIYAKGGFDKQLTEKLRLRGTASYYYNGSSGRNTLFAGDRTGSNYFMAMEAQKVYNRTTKVYDAGSATNQFTSGRISPDFSKKVAALQVNGFMKYGGLELFGTFENASGRNKSYSNEREFTQWAGDVVYRIGKKENVYIGARYNTVTAEFGTSTNALAASAAGPYKEVTINRTALAAGWFLTKNILLKGEYVMQDFKDFAADDYRNGGSFKGYVIEAVVGF